MRTDMILRKTLPNAQLEHFHVIILQQNIAKAYLHHATIG